MKAVVLHVCGPTTYPFPELVAEFQAPWVTIRSVRPRRAWVFYLARGTRLTGFALMSATVGM